MSQKHDGQRAAKCQTNGDRESNSRPALCSTCRPRHLRAILAPSSRSLHSALPRCRPFRPLPPPPWVTSSSSCPRFHVQATALPSFSSSPLPSRCRPLLPPALSSLSLPLPAKRHPALPALPLAARKQALPPTCLQRSSAKSTAAAIEPAANFSLIRRLITSRRDDGVGVLKQRQKIQLSWKHILESAMEVFERRYRASLQGAIWRLDATTTLWTWCVYI